jgi:chitin synthase
LRDDDMEAILEAGFDDDPQPPNSATNFNLHLENTPPNRSRYNVNSHRPMMAQQQPQQQYSHIPRYELTDSTPRFNAYGPPPTRAYEQVPPPPREHVVSPVSPFRPTDANSSAVEWKSHAKKRSIGRGGSAAGGHGHYGPLGPLDPGS